MEKQLDQQIGKLKTNCGGGFSSDEFLQFFKEMKA